MDRKVILTHCMLGYKMAAFQTLSASLGKSQFLLIIKKNNSTCILQQARTHIRSDVIGPNLDSNLFALVQKYWYMSILNEMSWEITINIVMASKFTRELRDYVFGIIKHLSKVKKKGPSADCLRLNDSAENKMKNIIFHTCTMPTISQKASIWVGKVQEHCSEGRR